MAVQRIYVEKISGFNVEAEQLLNDLRTFVGIRNLTGLRLLNRYDVEGIDEATFISCQKTIFSEPQVDRIYFDIPAADNILAVEYLPGQFDQRADSCAQCIQILSQVEKPFVRTARVYLFDGPLTTEELTAIRDYLINPVESREAPLAAFTTLVKEYQKPDPVPVLSGFRQFSTEGLRAFCDEYSLAMDLADLEFCQSYFQSEDRDPTLTEIRMIDTYWSDHCRHTTFHTILNPIKIEHPSVRQAYERYRQLRQKLGREDKPESLMDLATIGTRALKAEGRLPYLDESEEINACSVKLDVDVDGQNEPWLLMFKNETHNHPTEMEPFGGAATCVGGAIRDPLSGRAYAYQAMRVTGAGDPLTPFSETLPGKLPQRCITRTAAAGYSSYGNQVGLAAGQVRELYHPGYVAKRMELGAIIAAAPASHVIRQTPEPGDLVILLGGRTGRDGCGGATGSSKSHNLTSLESGGAEVQKGNAPEERKIIRLFRNPSVTRLIKRCNDFGAGGVSVAIGELASGLDINLDLIPTKYEGLDGTELAISESQERMAVVVAASDTEMFLRLTKEENLEATAIAQVTDKNRLTMHWQGQTIVDLAREFLDSNGAVKHATVEVSPQKLEHVSDYNSLAPESLRQGLEMLADDLNHCSQQGLVEQFDSTAGAATVLLPYGGRWQATPAPAMVAKLPLLKGETTTCSGMAFGYNSFLSEHDPYLGAYCAVVESLSKLVACGFDLKHVHLSFQEYFEKLADEPLRWGKPFAALLGALDAQLDFGVAAIGGKDSMSGSFEDLDVPPTLVSFAVAAGSTATIISPEFKKAGSRIVLLEPAAQKDGRPAPAGLLELFELLHQLIKNGQALSVQPLSTGGAAHGLYQMCLGNRIGARLNLLNTASASSLNSSSDNSAATLEADQLFRYAPGSFLVELAAGAALPKLHRSNQTDEFTNPRLTELGQTIESFVIEAAGENISLTELQKLSEDKLESIFTFNPPVYQADAKPPKLSYSLADQKQAESISGLSAAPKPHSDTEPKSTAAPRAFLRRSNNPQAQPPALIPAFPGTNCEYDVARALDQAGAKAQILVVRNLTPNDISETIDALTKAIRSSRIIVIPGGFSGGDEPDGSGKFITTMFRNPRVQEALDEFLNRRDGLMLGICNGFQALIKLGLVPYGEIREARPDSPTLASNRIGRHQSRLVHTRISSNLSPWLADCEVGDVFTMPVSHGEGRFVADPTLMAELAAKGQIAAQYVDLSGEPTSELPWNPNGSTWAVEAITSPDGRILGKMGHSERCGTSVHINVAGRCQPLFESGVKYFL